MKEELQSIINCFDYKKGLEWYCNHVQGKFFIKELLKNGQDPYNELKLKKELVMAMESLSGPYVTHVEKKYSDPISHESPELIPKSEKKIVEQAAMNKQEMDLDEEWKPMYKEANHYFEQIGHAKDAGERKTMAFKILDLMDKVEETWRAKDFLKTHGHLPNFQNAGVDELTIPQMVTRIRTIRTYISKAKTGRLDAKKIPKWEIEIEELERKIR